MVCFMWILILRIRMLFLITWAAESNSPSNMLVYVDGQALATAFTALAAGFSLVKPPRIDRELGADARLQSAYDVGSISGEPPSTNGR